MKHVKTILYPLSLVACLVLGWYVAVNSQTTILLVRHAEKLTGSNPSLTSAGQQRAENLINVLSDAGVGAIYSTEFCRTAETAKPVAGALGLTINVQPFESPSAGLENCTGLPAGYTVNMLGPEVGTAAELADYIVTHHRGMTVFAAGHSNTVPELVAAFGAPALCPDYFPLIEGDCRIPDDPANSQFDNLFIVKIPRFIGISTVIRAKYHLSP